MTKSVGVHQAKTHLSQLIEEVEHGDEVVITRRGVEVARLVPSRAPTKRQFGRDEGLWTLPADFDDPLPDDLLDLFEGKGE